MNFLKLLFLLVVSASAQVSFKDNIYTNAKIYFNASVSEKKPFLDECISYPKGYNEAKIDFSKRFMIDKFYFQLVCLTSDNESRNVHNEVYVEKANWFKNFDKSKGIRLPCWFQNGLMFVCNLVSFPIDALYVKYLPKSEKKNCLEYRLRNMKLNRTSITRLARIYTYSNVPENLDENYCIVSYYPHSPKISFEFARKYLIDSMVFNIKIIQYSKLTSKNGLEYKVYAKNNGLAKVLECYDIDNEKHCKGPEFSTNKILIKDFNVKVIYLKLYLCQRYIYEASPSDYSSKLPAIEERTPEKKDLSDSQSESIGSSYQTSPGFTLITLFQSEDVYPPTNETRTDSPSVITTKISNTSEGFAPPNEV